MTRAWQWRATFPLTDAPFFFPRPWQCMARPIQEVVGRFETERVTDGPRHERSEQSTIMDRGIVEMQ
eukprot:13648171-Alexandrium_andersonii.AAC.1